ncbi:S41 family peptidase [Mucilaginibacter jinjuensis]|uniref:S41 family peptidase n=1 Tax=Mucilaginibacter jinjuensis TaxID=1176721 RepID=A0ABY7TCU2_9SPHI|nr:S41 family peptidase [Mucilaginibacter jinjuensis]WCT14339.1 S41 family peptidase [Mucilaginibacter jinjuensis]
MRDTVSREDKLYALSMIWKEADYNFVFFDKQPNLNWDNLYVAYIPKILATKNVYEYFKVLQSFIGNLKDGHTLVSTPQAFRNDIDSPPVFYVEHNGKRYVSAVNETLKEQVPIGAEIVKLDGKTRDDLYLNNEWNGFKNTPIELTLLSPNGKESKILVNRDVNILGRSNKLKMVPVETSSATKDFEYKSLSPTVAIVTLNTFNDPKVINDFRQVLPEIRKHQNLILDIRRNQGGNDAYAIEMAKYLTDRPFIVGSMWRARTNNSANKAWASSNKLLGKTDTLTEYLTRNSWDKHPGDTINISDTVRRLKMQIYVLTSKNTFSAAEDFLIYLNGSKNITRVAKIQLGVPANQCFSRYQKDLRYGSAPSLMHSPMAQILSGSV